MLHCHSVNLDAMRAFAGPAACPKCGDLLVAPLASEFVEGSEIRHHWECEACGERTSSAIPLCGDE